MKKIAIPFACSLLLTSITVLAVDDPEMSAIDMTPDVREAPPLDINKTIVLEMTATVTAVDMENRLVTVEGPEGNSIDIQASDQVKNLAQVNVGDLVKVRYYRSALANIVKLGEGEKLGTVEMKAAGGTAAPGEKPAGVIGMQTTRRAEVVFVDPIQKFISFRSPDRGLRKITLADSPDLQHYLHELKQGDVVEVTYTEALAVSVEPAN